jgi:hypothetical protein
MTSADFGKIIARMGNVMVGRMLDGPMLMLKREHGLARKLEDD